MVCSFASQTVLLFTNVQADTCMKCGCVGTIEKRAAVDEGPRPSTCKVCRVETEWAGSEVGAVPLLKQWCLLNVQAAPDDLSDLHVFKLSAENRRRLFIDDIHPNARSSRYTEVVVPCHQVR